MGQGAFGSKLAVALNDGAMSRKPPPFLSVRSRIDSGCDPDRVFSRERERRPSTYLGEIFTRSLSGGRIDRVREGTGIAGLTGALHEEFAGYMGGVFRGGEKGQLSWSCSIGLT